MNCFNLVVLYIRLLFLIENIKYMTIKQIMLVVSILKDIGLLKPKKIVIFSSSWDKTPFDIIRFKSVRISYIFGQSQKTWEIVSLGAGLSFPNSQSVDMTGRDPEQNVQSLYCGIESEM